MLVFTYGFIYIYTELTMYCIWTLHLKNQNSRAVSVWFSFRWYQGTKYPEPFCCFLQSLEAKYFKIVLSQLFKFIVPNTNPTPSILNNLCISYIITKQTTKHSTFTCMALIVIRLTPSIHTQFNRSLPLDPVPIQLKLPTTKKMFVQ
jgi:hypothetical protein